MHTQNIGIIRKLNCYRGQRKRNEITLAFTAYLEGTNQTLIYRPHRTEPEVYFVAHVSYTFLDANCELKPHWSIKKEFIVS